MSLQNSCERGSVTAGDPSDTGRQGRGGQLPSIPSGVFLLWLPGELVFGC